MKNSRLKPINSLRYYLGLFTSLMAISLFSHNCAADKLQQSEKHQFNVVTISDELSHPWGMDFLPDGSILVTEKTGNIRVIKNGKLLPKPVQGLPKISETGQGGLLDVVAHPNFKTNRLIYFTYASTDKKGAHTNLARAIFKDNTLTDIKTFFTTKKGSFGVHFGSRIVFDKNNRLYVTVGDHGSRNNAQELNSLPGSVLRFNDDGSIPKDNPFINKKDAHPAIFTYGNRNPQGIAIDPKTGLIWASEFAPQGGDELNILTAGTNYGWPVITYGEEYGGGKIGKTHQKDMAQPIKYWVPSINPSGMTFYDGDQFPEWKGNLFIALLNGAMLRLTIKNKKVIAEEYLVKNFSRIRHVKQGPDGFIYFTTDNGKLLRMEPVNQSKAKAKAKTSFKLSSPAFIEGGEIPKLHACSWHKGQDKSPALNWTQGPNQTLSYAIVFIDRSNGLAHSAMWDIPANTTSLAADIDKTFQPKSLSGAKQSLAFHQQSNGYAGPCPGDRHQYEFVLHAVNTKALPGLSQKSTAEDVLNALKNTTLSTTSLSGYFTPKSKY